MKFQGNIPWAVLRAGLAIGLPGIQAKWEVLGAWTPRENVPLSMTANFFLLCVAASSPLYFHPVPLAASSTFCAFSHHDSAHSIHSEATLVVHCACVLVFCFHIFQGNTGPT